MKTIKHFALMLLAAIFALGNAVPIFALSIAVHVPEKYTDVYPGERFYFEIEIKYPENPSRKDLRLHYEIIKDDEVIAQAKFLKSIETQASFLDFIVIPESADNGLHTINVKIEDYEDLSEEVSASFRVINKSNQLRVYFFILLGAIALMGGIVVFEFHRNSK